MSEHLDPARFEAFRHDLQKELGPVSEKDFAFALDLPDKERRIAYGAFIDRYHEMFQSTKMLRPRDRSTNQIDLDRDSLHKQLIALGKTFDKSKAEVQFDLIRREGNLADYGFPELGVISYEDNDGWFGAQEVDTRTQKFYRETPEAKMNEHDRAERWEPDTTPEVLPVPGLGDVSHVHALAEGEVAVLFGAYVDEDLMNDPVAIIPPDFNERWRRASKLALKLGLQVFLDRTMQYHGAVTVVGVALKPEQLEDEFFREMKKHPETYRVCSAELEKVDLDEDRTRIIVEALQEFSRVRQEKAKQLWELYIQERHEKFNEPVPSQKNLLKQARALGVTLPDWWKESVDEGDELDAYDKYPSFKSTHRP